MIEQGNHEILRANEERLDKIVVGEREREA